MRSGLQCLRMRSKYVALIGGRGRLTVAPVRDGIELRNIATSIALEPQTVAHQFEISGIKMASPA